MKKFIKLLSLMVAFALVCPFVLNSCGGYKSKYDTVMEYNGIKLTEEFYNYWIATFKRNILASYSDASDTDEFWQQPYDENMTVEEYFTAILNERIINYLIAQDLYKKNGLKLSSSVKKAIENDIDEKIDFYGGRGSLNSALSEMKLNIDALEEIYLWEAKHDLVYDYLFGSGGPLEISDEDLTDYYEKNYSQIKYVVFYMTDIQLDEDGNYVYDSEGNLVSKELTEEEMAQKLAKINEFKTRIDNGEDFDTLIDEYSEYDTSAYPNGFFVSVNELDIWGPEIYKAVLAAEAGDVCRVDEEEAVFFVKKCELTAFEDLSESDITQLKNLVDYATDEIFNEFFAELSKNVKINSSVIEKYKLSAVKPNTHYSI